MPKPLVINPVIGLMLGLDAMNDFPEPSLANFMSWLLSSISSIWRTSLSIISSVVETSSAGDVGAGDVDVVAASAAKAILLPVKELVTGCITIITNAMASVIMRRYRAFRACTTISPVIRL